MRTDIQISYTSSSSGSGVTAVKDKTYDFGATDTPLKASDRQAYPDLVQFPTVAAAVVVAYNLPGVSGKVNDTLVLERDVIARIYLGEVRIRHHFPFVGLWKVASVPTCSSQKKKNHF